MFLPWIESCKWGKMTDKAKHQMTLPSGLSKNTDSVWITFVFSTFWTVFVALIWPKWSNLNWSSRTFCPPEINVLLLLLFLLPLKTYHAKIFSHKDSDEWGAKAKVPAIPRSKSYLNMMWKKTQNLTGIKVWLKSHCPGDGNSRILYMLHAYMFDCQR